MPFLNSSDPLICEQLDLKYKNKKKSVDLVKVAHFKRGLTHGMLVTSFRLNITPVVFTQSNRPCRPEASSAVPTAAVYQFHVCRCGNNMFRNTHAPFLGNLVKTFKQIDISVYT